MSKLSTHFDTGEFVCSCCGGSRSMSKILIDRLEKMHSMMNARAIIITSGYRCTKNKYGKPTDAHRKGLAADIKVQKQDGTWYTCSEIAECAQRIGFGGIGLMPPDACHVDTRDCEPYTNNHWFGCEYDYGNYKKSDNITTFQTGKVFPSRSDNKNTIKLYLNNTLIYSKEI